MMDKAPRSSDISTEFVIKRNITRHLAIVRFRSYGTVGYGPTLNKKGLDIQCDQVARYDREQLVNHIGNNISAKGEGRGGTIFLLVKMRRTNWQSSCSSVVTEKSSTIVTSCTDKVVH